MKLPPGGEDADFICDLCLRYKQSQDGPVGPNGLPPSPQIIKLRVGPPSPEKTRGPFDGVAGSAVTANGSPKHSGPTAMDIEDSPTITGNPSSGIEDNVGMTPMSLTGASDRKDLPPTL